MVAAAVADGRLHLTAVVLLAPHLTGDSAEELVAKASGKSKADIEMMLARHAPKPDVSERLERMVEQTSLVLDRGDSGEVVLEPVPPVPPKVEAKRFGKVKNPRAAKTSRLKAYVPNEARRQALARDGLRCSFVAEDGRRCERSAEERLPEVLRALRAMYASRGTGTRCREPVRAFAHANVGSA